MYTQIKIIHKQKTFNTETGVKMSLIRQNIKLVKIFQGESLNRNRIILEAAKCLEFPIPNIRKALVDLNGLKLSQIANDGVSYSSLANTIRGTRLSDDQAKAATAKWLDLEIDELFCSQEK